MEKKPKNIFVQGPVEASFIAESIRKHSTNTGICAHGIFLGQVRADVMDGKTVAAIDYTTNEEMALKQMHVIREAIFEKYSLTCMHIHHSLERVKAGEIFLFVFTSSRHRNDALDACAEVVALIGKELPVWGKEVYEVTGN